MSSRVNQKLYYARLALDQAETGAAGPRREALREAAIWHLAIAYRSHLVEIAGGYRHNGDVESATALARGLAGRDIRCAAVTELEQMERAGDWPAHLLHAFDAVSDPQPAPAARNTGAIAVDAAGPIALKMLDAVPDTDDCRRWLNALEALVMMQREHLQEW